MALSFRFEPLIQINENKLIDIEDANSKFVKFLEKNFQRLYEFLISEDKLGNYIEIDIPQLDTNFSFKLNLFHGKTMITVLDHVDSIIFGHLIIDSFDCLGLSEIKQLGDYRTHQENFKRLIPSVNQN